MAMRNSRARRPGTRSPGVKPGRPSGKALNAQDARKMLLESMAEQNISKMRYVLPFAKEFYIPEATLAENLLQFFSEKEQWDRDTTHETHGSTRTSPTATPRSGAVNGSPEELEDKVQKHMNSLIKRSRFQPWAHATDTEDRLEREVKMHMDVIMERRHFQQVIWPVENSDVEENKLPITRPTAASSSRDRRPDSNEDGESLGDVREDGNFSQKDGSSSQRKNKSPKEVSREPRRERGLAQREARRKQAKSNSPRRDPSRTPDTERRHNVVSPLDTDLGQTPDAGLATQVESQLNALLQAFPVIREKLVSLEERMLKVEQAANPDEIKKLCEQFLTQVQASLEQQVKQIRECVLRNKPADTSKPSIEENAHSKEALGVDRDQVETPLSADLQQLKEDWDAKLQRRDTALEQNLQQSLEATLKSREENKEKDLRDWLTTIVARQDGKTLERLEARLDEQKTWLVSELAKKQSAVNENDMLPAQEMETPAKMAGELASIQEFKQEWETKLRDRDEQMKDNLTEEAKKLLELGLKEAATSLNGSLAQMNKDLESKLQLLDEKFQKLIVESAKADQVQKVDQVQKEADAATQPVIREFPRADVTFQQKLGEGAVGQVWLGSVSSIPGATVAIKSFPGDQGTDVFNLERDCLSRLQHPNIVTMIGIVSDNEGNLLLIEHLQACVWPDLNPAAAISDVLKALVYIHSRSVVHLDIKPDNVMQDANGMIKLIDFSVGTSAEEKHRGFIGSLPFAAPELLEDAPWLGKPVDLYAVGILVAFLVQLKALFDHLGFALQLNDDSVARKAALPQIRTGVSSLSQEMIRIAGPAGTLAARLMDIEPSLRPTAQHALTDPWVKPYLNAR